MEEKIVIKLKGPLRWYGHDRDNVFNSASAKNKGVYLFVAPYKDSFLVEYVGMTDRSFHDRFKSHIRSYFSGKYRIRDLKAYLKGENKAIYEGTFPRKNADQKNHAIQDFKAHKNKYESKILEHLDAMRLFIFPIDKDKRTIERIEVAISDFLSNQSAPVGTFKDTGVTYRRRKKEEHPIQIKIINKIKILGLPNELII